MERPCNNEILEILRSDVKPALGCTEPIAVALAVAVACEELSEVDAIASKIKVEVSANILKNGMGVGIPGTGMIGLYVASALASVCGKSEYGLEVLKDVCSESVELAKHLVDNKFIEICLADTPKKLYIAANAIGKDIDGVEHNSRCVIADNHDSVVLVELDGVATFKEGDDSVKEEVTSGVEDISDDVRKRRQLTIEKVYDFATTVPIEDIDFMREAIVLNKNLSEEGLMADYGLRVGKTIASKPAVFGSAFMTRCMSMTAAASDARMAGCTLPAMSNSGSGNQGIAVTLPVVAAAAELGSSEEQLLRAMTLSHLVAIHIKSYLGKLSALCGCVVASTGASCGIVLLKGGTLEQAGYCIKNMVGNITGMVCDGAKVGCAMKVASGVSSAVQSAILALDDICISSNDGIIEDNLEKTIQNLGVIGTQGMASTDKMILDIMVCK